MRLGRQAAEACLATAGMTPTDVDMIITVSCTGFMIPSLDAHLINLMGFRPDVRRLPITELGCAAGAMALSRAWEFVRAFPGKTVLIVSVELATLTFQRGDLSQANLISCVLFGDGAAAALVTGRDVAGPRILDADTYTFPTSLDAMGFDLRDSGFHIVLSKDVPQMIRERIAELTQNFLARSGLTRSDVTTFLLHPGGQKLLSYIEEQLGLCRCDTELSWEVLDQVRQPVERDDSVHPSRVPDEEEPSTWRLRTRGGVRAGIQRRVPAAAMAVSAVAYVGLLALVALFRGVELLISRRHQQALDRLGAHTATDPHFVWMVALHAAILIGAALEVILLGRPFIPLLAIASGAVVVFANALRWWVIYTLGTALECQGRRLGGSRRDRERTVPGDPSSELCGCLPRARRAAPRAHRVGHGTGRIRRSRLGAVEAAGGRRSRP